MRRACLFVGFLAVASPALAQDDHGVQRSEQWRQERRAENRALLMREWGPLLDRVSGISTVFSCGVYDDQQTANLALLEIGNIMSQQQIDLGLIGDATLDADHLIQEAAQKGKAAATPSVCEAARAMPPAERARMRQDIARLARLAQ